MRGIRPEYFVKVSMTSKTGRNSAESQKDEYRGYLKSFLFVDNEMPSLGADEVMKVQEGFISTWRSICCNVTNGISQTKSQIETYDFVQAPDEWYRDVVEDFETEYDRSKDDFEDALYRHLNIDTSQVDETKYGSQAGSAGLLGPLMQEFDFFAILCCIEKTMEKFYGMRTAMYQYEFAGDLASLTSMLYYHQTPLFTSTLG